MKVISTLKIIEFEGKDVPFAEQNSAVLHVHSHWNIEGLVVLEVAGGQNFTVDARQLSKAIQHATNWK